MKLKNILLVILTSSMILPMISCGAQSVKSSTPLAVAKDTVAVTTDAIVANETGAMSASIMSSNKDIISDTQLSHESSGEISVYPEFSWERLPQYGHVFGAPDGLTDEEVELLAKYCPIITLEKGTGKDIFPSCEEGMYSITKRIKAINPDAKVLFYWNVLMAYDTGYSAYKEFLQHPDWILKDKTGKPFTIRGRVQCYDLTKPEVRKWWIDKAYEAVTKGGMDGVFLDANVKVIAPMRALLTKLGEERYQELRTGYFTMMDELNECIGENKIILANLLRVGTDGRVDGFSDYAKHFTGTNVESPFSHSENVNLPYEEYMTRAIDMMQKTAAKKKIVTMATKYLDKSDQANVDLAIAMYLLFAEEHSYIGHVVTDGDGGSDLDADENDDDLDEGIKRNDQSESTKQDRAKVPSQRKLVGRFAWYPEYDKPVGKPLGPAERDGYTFTREFEHVSVKLDLKQQKTELNWR